MSKNHTSSQEPTVSTAVKNYHKLSTYVLALLLAVLAFGAVNGRVWESDTKTVKATGEVSLEAYGDESVFTLTYSFKDTDRSRAREALETKRQAVVSGLTALGIAEENITDNSKGGEYPSYFESETTTNDSVVYQLTLSIVTPRNLSVSTADYLATTGSFAGSLTPTDRFSATKQAELVAKGLEESLKVAAANAQSAVADQNATLGKIVTVNNLEDIANGCGMGISCPVVNGTTVSGVTIAQSTDTVLRYGVTVTYELKK